jgi:Fic family protein
LNEEFRATPDTSVAFGILKAIIAHLYLAWIHPFGDGNGRTARLVEFQLLLSVGVPSPAAHLLSNHYNETRQEYYRQLDRASKSGGDILPFIEYALAGFVDGLRKQINVIREQQWSVAWENYIYKKLEGKGAADVRKRQLMLDLSLQRNPVPISNIKNISARIATNYYGKSDKTISRDINALIHMGLVERTNEGIRAKPEIILAFLPHQRE